MFEVGSGEGWPLPVAEPELAGASDPAFAGSPGHLDFSQSTTRSWAGSGLCFTARRVYTFEPGASIPQKPNSVWRGEVVEEEEEDVEE